MATLRTHSSSLAMSVSSSQGLTSSRMEDLATSSARRCSRILAASVLSSSSSEPKRSTSSSPASLAGGAARGDAAVAGKFYLSLHGGCLRRFTRHRLAP
uniref:Uncharacterized protein n=1 Tax=Fundulus heteroclitus TaxID=8078 RepID=A0A3Q2PYR6_FUNHE